MVAKKNKIPKVGDKIYVTGAMYIDHGEDDVAGGLATVTKVEKQYNSVFVSIKEHPGRTLNWAFLEEKQTELKKEYGRKKAKPDPDCGG